MKLTALLLMAVTMHAEPLRVMTFNVRFPAKGDGENIWEKRRDLLVATVREKAPDVMGAQELFYEQGEYIVERLPEYAWFGVSRRGNRDDEHMGVFYRKEKLRLVESGNFWLSETPEAPGSIAWDMSLPRMVTWGLFEIRASARRFYFYNTHFAHRRQDDEARLRSARLIDERLARLPDNALVILTGDFNTTPESDPYRVLTGRLRDAWRAAAKPAGPEGTFHGFSGKPGAGRIDWILYRPDQIRVLEVETVTRNDAGRYPSDHFPVFAVLELPAK
jgi:endonuclease/exonuclease/phosphatase family metal-dependent hydrolase